MKGSKSWHDPNTQFDTELGWAPVLNRSISTPYGKVSSNPLGFRSGDVDPGKKHIILLGDSVTWGYGLGDEQIMSAFLQEKLPHEQVLNLSVSGYGFDQYYLYLKKNLPLLNPKKVILIICLHNDVKQTMWNSAYGKRKPHFKLINGKLVLSNPKINKYCLRNVLSKSWFLSRAMKKWPSLEGSINNIAGDESNDIETTRVIVEKLVEMMKDLSVAKGAEFAVVLSPMQSDFSRKSHRLEWLQDFFKERHYDYLDLYIYLKNKVPDPASLFLDFTHYNEEGHRTVAQALHERFLKGSESA